MGRIVLCVVVVIARVGFGDEPSPPVVPDEISLRPLLPNWLTLGAAYRVQTIFIDPLELNGTDVTHTFWTEQRLRLDLGFKWPEVGGIYVQADFLDGVLFGDNGTFGGDPSPNSGLAIASKNPNNAGWTVGLKDGGDPLDPRSYVPVLKSLSPFALKLAYGEVSLPLGLLRVGRMPLSDGGGIAAHDGSDINRWGTSHFVDTADRVLFATKIDEIVATIREGAGHKADPSQKNGVILALTYDWNVQDSIQSVADDAYQVNLFLSWRKERADWFGVAWRDFQLTATMVYKGNKEFETAIWSLPIRFQAHIGPASLNLQFSLIAGKTREVSEGLALLSNRPVAVQELLQFGAHAYFDYRVGPATIGFEFDYASGDDDPRTTTRLTQFNFARDFNVGLLLFKHTMAFQTARSAAVGIENLRKLGARSFPLTEIASQGRFGNAIAIFPQVKFDILEGPRHWLHTRIGVLAAWAAAPVVDPIATTLRYDGNEIADDAVNFHGGKPGRYYGTEFDFQLSWKYRGFFTWTVEAAALIPGDAVRDANGDAVASFLVENRFLFQF